MTSLSLFVDSDPIPWSFKYFNHKTKVDFTCLTDRHTLTFIINDMRYDMTPKNEKFYNKKTN